MIDPVIKAVRQSNDGLCTLAENEVRIYWFKLPDGFELVDKSEWLDGAILSTEEQARAAKFRMDIDKLRFVSARKILREVLAKELGVSSNEVPLVIQDDRPKLADNSKHDIRFNISHSGEWVMVGISRETEIGVDVEVRKPLTDLIGISKRVMTAQEFDLFRQLNLNEQHAVFLRLWAAKESILKYLGTGFRRAPETLSIGLPNLCVSSWKYTGPELNILMSGGDDSKAFWAVSILGEKQPQPLVQIHLN